MNVLRTVGMHVPSTFAQYSSEAMQPTFVARGARRTDDYVVVTSDVCVHDHSTRVCTQFDPGTKAHDHLPVCSTVWLPKSFKYGAVKRRVVGYDRRGFKDPAKSSLFANLLQQFSPVPFWVDPHSHAYLLDTYVCNALASAFPKPRIKPKKAYVSQECAEHIYQKARIFKAYHQA
eukprot:6005076-Karenia_brevis.AAC.1